MDFMVEKWKFLWVFYWGMAVSTGGKSALLFFFLFWSENCLLGHNLSKLFGKRIGGWKEGLRLIHMHSCDIVNSKG